MPTIIIEEQDKHLRPTTPFEPSVRLAKELAFVEKRAVFVEQIHVLKRRIEHFSSIGGSLLVTHNSFSLLEDEVCVVCPDFNPLLSRSDGSIRFSS